MLEKGKISGRQLMVLVLLYTIGDSILVLPTIVTAEANRDAWISGLLAIGLGPLIMSYLYQSLAKSFPDLTVVEYGERIFGKWIGKIVAFLFVTYFFITASTYLREIGDFINTEFLPKTPMIIVTSFFMIIIIMAANLGLETLVRSAEFFFPIIFFLLLLLFVCLLPSIQFDYIKPMVEEGIKPIIRGTIPFIALPFMEPVAILMVLPYVSNKKIIRKSLFRGALLGGIVLFTTSLFVILVLGANFSANNLYPSYELARSIAIEDLFRIEASLAIIWLITIFIRLSLFFYVTALGIAQMLELKEYRLLNLPLALLLIVFTMVIGSNVIEYNQIISGVWVYYVITFGFGIPFIMWVVTRLRFANQ